MKINKIYSIVITLLSIISIHAEDIPVAVVLGDTLYLSKVKVEDETAELFYLNNNITSSLFGHTVLDSSILDSVSHHTQWCNFEKQLYRKFGGELLYKKTGCLDYHYPIDAIGHWLAEEETENRLIILHPFIRKKLRVYSKRAQ